MGDGDPGEASDVQSRLVSAWSDADTRASSAESWSGVISDRVLSYALHARRRLGSSKPLGCDGAIGEPLEVGGVHAREADAELVGDERAARDEERGGGQGTARHRRQESRRELRVIIGPPRPSGPRDEGGAAGEAHGRSLTTTPQSGREGPAPSHSIPGEGTHQPTSHSSATAARSAHATPETALSDLTST